MYEILFAGSRSAAALGNVVISRRSKITVVLVFLLAEQVVGEPSGEDIRYDELFTAVFAVLVVAFLSRAGLPPIAAPA